MSTIVLEPTNEADAALLLSLAHRLGVKATTISSLAASTAERVRLVEEFAGSWQSDEDGTELARQLREARYFRDRDLEL